MHIKPFKTGNGNMLENCLSTFKNVIYSLFPPPSTDSSRIKSVILSPYIRLVVFFAISFIFFDILFHSVRVEPQRPVLNHFVHQAQALLDGNIDIPNHLPDTAIYNGKYYVIYPPFPTLILLPLVAMFGMRLPLTVICIIMTLISLYALTCIFANLKIEKRFIPWLLVAFFWGTGYWYSLSWSEGVGFFAHIAAVMTMLLAISESMRKGRGWLVGLFLGASFLSRQLSIYFTLFFIVMLWENINYNTDKKKVVNILSFFFTLGIAGLIYISYNWLRFGNIFETGYGFIELGSFCRERVEMYGQFSIHYIPFNFVYMFLQGYHMNFGGSTNLAVEGVNKFGTALTFASPFVFFAFWAKLKKSLLYAAWVSIILTIIHQLMYYNNGWIQYNTQRFTLDFLPLLMVLVALGTKKVPGKVWKPFIVFAVFLNALTFMIIPRL